MIHHALDRVVAFAVTSLAVLVLLLLSGCQVQQSYSRSSNSRPGGSTAVTALIGGTDYHKLTYERADPNNPNNVATADLSTMPALGIAGHQKVGGKGLEFGVDGGFLVSWENDHAEIRSPGNTVIVLVDRKLLLLDLFLGAYASTIVADRVRLYAAVGPNLIYGEADFSDETFSQNDSAVGFGGYVRGGAELRLADRSFMGAGVRWVATELDFDGDIGDVDVEGWQYFLTFTQGF